MNLDHERLSAIHGHFAADCFNRCWDLIDKPERTPEEDEEMLRLTMASHWHWTQRDDCTPLNRSVAYWQASRVFALLGQADNARVQAERALAIIDGLDAPPFYLAYGHEGLARAALVDGNLDRAHGHLARARELAAGITDEESLSLLVPDLDALEATAREMG